MRPKYILTRSKIICHLCFFPFVSFSPPSLAWLSFIIIPNLTYKWNSWDFLPPLEPFEWTWRHNATQSNGDTHNEHKKKSSLWNVFHEQRLLIGFAFYDSATFFFKYSINSPLHRWKSVGQLRTMTMPTYVFIKNK